MTMHSSNIATPSLAKLFNIPQLAPTAHLIIPVSHDIKKGFGSSSKTSRTKKPAKQSSGDAADQKAVVLREGSPELRSVLKSLEKDDLKKQSKGLNINKDVAAKGKVDFAKVESWGAQDGQKTELEELKVKSFSSAASFTDNKAPFYERLVHRLQLLESKGDLSIAQPQMLPPFQEWVFGEKRFLQYLVDQHAVFDALRFAVSSIEQSAGRDDADSSERAEHGEVAMAVGIFNERLGLERSKVLQKDIEALSIAMSASDDKANALPKTTTQTTAYVKYLKQLVRIACSEKDRKQACLQLIAHIFAIYVTHLTTGMRVGAKALDSIVVLKKAKAVSFYRDYPQHVTDPLKIFIAAVNKITDYVLLLEDQEKVMDELPRAIQKTSLLLSILAVKEQLNNKAVEAL